MIRECHQHNIEKREKLFNVNNSSYLKQYRCVCGLFCISHAFTKWLLRKPHYTFVLLFLIVHIRKAIKILWNLGTGSIWITSQEAIKAPAKWDPWA